MTRSIVRPMADVPGDPAERTAILASIEPENARAHHDLLRSFFREEMEHRRTGGSDEHFENLYWCAYLLYEVGDPGDTPMMWEAKHLDFDTAVGFDVQFLVGAGVNRTLEYLRSHGYWHIATALAEYPELREDLNQWAEFRRGYFYAN